MMTTRWSGRRAALAAVVLSLILLLSPANARRGMGGGTGDDEEEDLGGMAASSAQGRMRSSLCRMHWRIDPLSPSEIRSAPGLSREMADHVAGILGRKGEPLHVRLRERPVAAAGGRKPGAGSPVAYSPGGTGDAYRAIGSIGRLASFGRRVRATWTSGPPSRSRGFRDEDLLRTRFEEATFHNFNRLEIEVTLPRVRGGGRGALPAVVYRFPVGEGEVNPQGFVAAGRGIVRVYPEGVKGKDSGGPGRGVRSAGEDDEDGGIEVGRIAMHASAGASLVDPAWAKGRKFFWEGRPAGKM